MILDRTSALELLRKHIKNERMIIHSLSSEAVLSALAFRLGQNVESWAQAGLLHDLDVEFTNANPLTHGITAAKWLEEMGFDARHDKQLPLCWLSVCLKVKRNAARV